MPEDGTFHVLSLGLVYKLHGQLEPANRDKGSYAWSFNREWERCPT
jgi:hypothetical protein